MLTPEQLRGARHTGAWAMPLMVIGFVGLVLPAAVYLFFVVFVGALGLVTGGAGAVGIFALIAAFVGGGALAQYPLLVLIPLGVGAAALVGASWGSVRALRALGIRSPRKTTWIAFAAGLAALSIISGAVSTMLLGIFGLFDGSAGQFFTAGAPVEDGDTFLAREIIFYSIMLLVCVPLGLLAWPVFARLTTRTFLARESAKQQADAAAEWAAYEWARYEWAQYEWARYEWARYEWARYEYELAQWQAQNPQSLQENARSTGA